MLCHVHVIKINMFTTLFTLCTLQWCSNNFMYFSILLQIIHRMSSTMFFHCFDIGVFDKDLYHNVLLFQYLTFC